ncbi:MAG: hypothetical protein U9P81_11130 [Euryarchaeota archaeon]|nr:hypothetical protein [Euryarchaeota archaeon]
MNSISRKKRSVAIILLLIIVIIPTAQIAQASSNTNSIPPNKWTFDNDYFTVYGNPEIVISTVGNPEYNRDESSSILIKIMNQGKVLGFESNDKPEDANEIALSKIELQQEYGVTTALGVIASVSPMDAPLDIKTPPQSAGTIISGQVSDPLQFDMEIWDNAKAGTYQLLVDLTYQYQEDVQIEGNATTNEIDSNILYKEVNETHIITIIVNKQADFEALSVESGLLPDTSGILSITFKNTGEEKATRATARLRLSDPLSSTDFTAYLGDMEPEDIVGAKFDIDVDKDATPKVYSVTVEIEYEDMEGEIKVSDSIYVPVEVKEAKKEAGFFQNPILIIGIVLVLAVLLFFLTKRRKGDRGTDK